MNQPTIRKGKIYRLICHDGHFYYGSTIQQYLSRRIARHRENSQIARRQQTRVYRYINTIGWNNVKIELVEEFDYTTKEDMLQRENTYIVKSLNDPLCLNNNRAIVTAEEKAEQILKHCLIIKARKNAIVHCECGMDTTVGREAQHRRSFNHRSRMPELDMVKPSVWICQCGHSVPIQDIMAVKCDA